MDPWIRAADADRERVVAALQHQVGAGRLTLDEFSDRAAAAYRARTIGELGALTRDLPAVTPKPASAPARRFLVPVLTALTLLLLGALLAFAGPAAADAAGPMMAHVGSACG